MDKKDWNINNLKIKRAGEEKMAEFGEIIKDLKEAHKMIEDCKKELEKQIKNVENPCDSEKTTEELEAIHSEACAMRGSLMKILEIGMQARTKK